MGAFVRAMSSSDRVPSASVYEAAAPSPYYPVLPPPVGYDPGAMTTLRDRALYERDLDRLYHINKEERDGAIASQGAIEKELFATKGVMQGVLAEKEQVEDTLHQVKDAGEQLKRQFELALCTSVAERKEYETTVATMHAEREAERGRCFPSWLHCRGVPEQGCCAHQGVRNSALQSAGAVRDQDHSLEQ